MSNQDQIPQVRLALKDDLSNIVDFNISMALETENITLNKNEITQGVQASSTKTLSHSSIIA